MGCGMDVSLGVCGVWDGFPPRSLWGLGWMGASVSVGVWDGCETRSLWVWDGLSLGLFGDVG